MAYLWLVRRPPYPPLRGGALDYSRALIESLAQNAEVLALTYPEKQEVPPPRPGLTWKFLPAPRHFEPASLISMQPNVAFRNVDKAYLAEACALAVEADAVFVDFIAMAWLVEPLKAALSALPAPPPLIFLTHNHEHAIRRQMARAARSPLMRLALGFDSWKAGRLERGALAAADGATGITAADVDDFSRLVDTPLRVLWPVYVGPVRESRAIDASVPRAMTVLGNRDSQHKRMILEETLKVLAASGLPTRAQVDVAGGGIDRQDVQARFPDFSVIGFVDDLEAYCGSIRLGLLTDTIGGGFKIRAMSYAMLRVPMLALREAMHGMDFEEGVHFIGVDTLEKLAETAAALIDDLDRLNALQEAAFAFARERFRPEAAAATLEAIVADARRRPK